MNIATANVKSVVRSMLRRLPKGASPQEIQDYIRLQPGKRYITLGRISTALQEIKDDYSRHAKAVWQRRHRTTTARLPGSDSTQGTVTVDQLVQVKVLTTRLGKPTLVQLVSLLA